MNKKLLTLEDLYGFYSQKKKSMSFSAEKSGYNIAVQTHAVFELEDYYTEKLEPSTICPTEIILI